MTLDRIVVGVDFSAPSVAAANWAARHFAPGAEVVLVHALVIPEPPIFLRGRYPARDTLVATARDGADRRLREMSQSLGATRIWLEVREGKAADVIASVAEEYTADVIVVGTHGEHPGVWGRLGSTAEHVARQAERPVLLATGTLAGEPRKLLAAVDDAAITHGVLDWTRDLARRHSAEATALHVVSSAVLGTLGALVAIVSGTPEPDFTTLDPAARDEANQWMQRLTSSGFDGVNAHMEIAYGDPAQQILATAARLGSDLIVMGREGAGAVRGAALGSVVHDVLRATRCPVLMVATPAAPSTSPPSR
jgi:nucleotide-binding universal stress UspA family protein